MAVGVRVGVLDGDGFGEEVGVAVGVGVNVGVAVGGGVRVGTGEMVGVGVITLGVGVGVITLGVGVGTTIGTPQISISSIFQPEKTRASAVGPMPHLIRMVDWSSAISDKV